MSPPSAIARWPLDSRPVASRVAASRSMSWIATAQPRRRVRLGDRQANPASSAGDQGDSPAQIKRRQRHGAVAVACACLSRQFHAGFSARATETARSRRAPSNPRRTMGERISCGMNRSIGCFVSGTIARIGSLPHRSIAHGLVSSAARRLIGGITVDDDAGDWMVRLAQDARRQERVIDRAKTRPRDDHGGKSEPADQVQDRVSLIQRHKQPADAFDKENIARADDCIERALDRGPVQRLLRAACAAIAGSERLRDTAAGRSHPAGADESA